MLAMDPGTRKEIKLTRDQDKKIQDALKQMQADMQAGKIAIDFMEPMASMDAVLDPILDESQRARLEELYIQANGGFALTDARTAPQLGLSDEQKDALKQIKAEANKDLMASMRSMNSNSAIKAAQKKRDQFADRMLATLTPDQKAKFEALKGKPFKFKS
jgi:hypothetical protein